MAVITISREFASGGRKLGRRLAKRLNYDYVDKSLFQKIAEDLHVSEKTLWSFEDSRMYRVANLFSHLFSKDYIERIVGYDKTVVEEREYQDALRHLVLGMAEKGDLVIVGRAAHFFLKDTPNCYRFRLVASTNWRIKYAIAQHGVRSSEAERILEEREKKRMWFYRSICGEGFDDPRLSHLTLNRGLIPFETAVELCLMAVNSRY